MKKFPFISSESASESSFSCIRMVSKFYGKVLTAETNYDIGSSKHEAPDINDICDFANLVGFQSSVQSLELDGLKKLRLPVIVFYKERYVVLFKVRSKYVIVGDPISGLLKLEIGDFIDGSRSGKDSKVETVITLLPTSQFYESEKEKSFSLLFGYLKPYKKYFFQIFLGMILGSLLQLILPLLTQSIVDIGINQKDIDFINLVLIGQIFFFISKVAIDFIRSWILLHIGIRLNFSLLSEFILKIFKLPISYFNRKHIGDILQRINDHKRIENFLNSSLISIIYSSLNLIVFSLVLALYSLKIFFVFLLGSTLYIVWVLLFMRYRKKVDDLQFKHMAANQNILFQMIMGMKEIKLQNSENERRWEWEGVQSRLHQVNLQGLWINQYQKNGALLINEIKNLVIIYFSSIDVISGSLTLGMMLAIQYIIAQLNAPISDMVSFFRISQEARISLDRLNEINSVENEEVDIQNKLDYVPSDLDIHINNLSFSYDESFTILKDINLTIPKGKVTAIVGPSGSGKTTLLKLLLKFYSPDSGNIMIDHTNLGAISNKKWRDKCGAVLQEGYIFSDTIAKNVSIKGKENYEKIMKSLEAVNLIEFIESLPNGIKTQIGQNGLGLSEGQKQRVLLARLVYKNPDFLLLDEATNSLDASNERVILDNLNSIFVGKTAIVVAHRLSTVVNAHQIAVLKNGEIIEQGSHNELVSLKGEYFKLIKDQLELGN